MEQFKSLIRKNGLLWKRGFVGSFLQIVVPIALFTVLVAIRNAVDIEKFDEGQSITNSSRTIQFQSQYDSSFLFVPYLKKCTDGKYIGISPSSNPLSVEFKNRLENMGHDVLLYANEKEIETVLGSPEYEDSLQFCFVVIFQNEGDNYTYTYRGNIKDGNLDPRSKLTIDEEVDMETYFEVIYETSMVQTAIMINSMIFEQKTGISPNSNFVSPMYNDKYEYDKLYYFFGGSIGLVVVLPLLLVFARQVSLMAMEKQKKIKINMLIMGMSLPLYHLVWFLHYYIIYVVIHVVCSGITISALPSIPFYMPFVIFLLFDIVLIIQAFFVQILFDRLIYAIIFACLFFSLQSFVVQIISDPQATSVSLNQGMSAIPHVAVALAFKEMLYADSKHLPIDFSTQINYYTINTCIISLCLNIIFWGILTLYLSQVVPGNWKRKHPLFCFGVELEKQENSTQSDNNEEMKSNNFTAKNLEIGKMKEEDERIRQLDASKKLIKMKNLVKDYDDVHAVKGLDLVIPLNQIFILLGPNGSGKTTTISMLTGMIQPTQGSIQMFGETQYDKFRQVLGICPQINPLYGDLTPQQHLQLFGSFKGVRVEHLQKQINDLLKNTKLQQKRETLVKHLSGGQKRKLSIALAFTGKSKVIVLDEPTAGMDINARRSVWKMLKHYRNGRTIIMTTHLMDEADHLADRIGVLIEGKLKVLGSSLSLKNKYGLGYNMTVVKKQKKEESESITAFVRDHIPEAKILSDSESELTFQLGFENVSKFDNMLNELQQKKPQLNIKEYGIRITTLEEVFLALCEKQPSKQMEIRPEKQQVEVANKKRRKGERISKRRKKVKKVEESSDSKNKLQEESQKQIPDKVQGFCRIFCMHLLATLLKRWRIARRDKRSILFEIVLPILFILIGLIFLGIVVNPNIESESLSYQTYIDEEATPIIIPIGTYSNSTLLTTLKDAIQRRYGNQVNVTTSIKDSEIQFDFDSIKSVKREDPLLKGGIFFKDVFDFIDSNNNNLFNISIPLFTSLVNTRSPTSFIAVQNLAFQTYMNALTNTTSSINFINTPLPNSQGNFRKNLANNVIKSAFGVGIFSAALAFKFASIAFLLVKEKETGAKHQQLICGMKISAYWLGNFIFDYLTYSLIAGFAIAMCFAFDIQGLIGSKESVEALCILFFLYGFCNMFFTYIFTFVFSESFNALVGVCFFNLINGAIITLVLILLRVIAQNTLIGAVWFFRLFPAFAFGEGVVNMGSKSTLQYLSSSIYEVVTFQIFDMDIALGPIIYLAATSIPFLITLIIIEIVIHHKNKIHSITQKKASEIRSDSESDINNEQKEIANGQPESYQIFIKYLTKVYEEKVTAVNNISFGVKKGEIFGLLGSNGAGKSTTFKMLTGELLPTSGQMFFQGFSINQNVNEIRQNLGYCPQTDPIVQYLSVRQQLELYYDMKCLSPEKKDKTISQEISQLNLQKFEDKLSINLSEGNKRKLSVAIAIIGRPGIILLDEPSTGMDPKTKRFMWRVIEKITLESRQSSIILTTHSMDEAQALSTKLAIMMNGKFKCIGTPLHIKSKYGQGLEIQVKMKNIEKELIEEVVKKVSIEESTMKKEHLEKVFGDLGVCEQVKKEISQNGSGNYIWEQFEEGKEVYIETIVQFCIFEQKIQQILQSFNEKLGRTQIMEHLSQSIRYKVKDENLIGNVFNFMEKNKNKQFILEYSIDQPTIQQIFNNFANEENRQQIVKPMIQQK